MAANPRPAIAGDPRLCRFRSGPGVVPGPMGPVLTKARKHSSKCDPAASALVNQAKRPAGQARTRPEPPGASPDGADSAVLGKHATCKVLGILTAGRACAGTRAPARDAPVSGRSHPHGQGRGLEAAEGAFTCAQALAGTRRWRTAIAPPPLRPCSRHRGRPGPARRRCWPRGDGKASSPSWMASWKCLRISCWPITLPTRSPTLAAWHSGHWERRVVATIGSSSF